MYYILITFESSAKHLKIKLIKLQKLEHVETKVRKV